ncbi:MAG TPA: hypothetical protein VGS96_07500 [Thermoanaerobaculia bacterium]|nr:hypothetical protein [Thermoanaerobaculia bacterium]
MRIEDTSKQIGSSWIAPVQVSASRTNDQFMPAFDPNTLGEMTVSYYSRHQDTNNVRYRNYFNILNVNGGKPAGNSDMPMTPATDYDPADQPRRPGFLGDYQDVWSWDFGGDYGFNSAWTRAGTATAVEPSDIMITGIR